MGQNQNDYNVNLAKAENKNSINTFNCLVKLFDEILLRAKNNTNNNKEIII